MCTIAKKILFFKQVLILFSINKDLEDKKLLKLLSILSYTQLQTETDEK